MFLVIGHLRSARNWSRWAIGGEHGEQADCGDHESHRAHTLDITMIERAAFWVAHAGSFVQSALVFVLPASLFISIIFAKSAHQPTPDRPGRTGFWIAIPITCVMAVLYGIVLGYVGFRATAAFGASFSNYVVYGYFACMLGLFFVLYDSAKHGRP